MFVSIGIALGVSEPLVATATFAISGIAFSADAARHRAVYQAFVGALSFVFVIWSLLLAFEIDEPQAYILPLGLGLLFTGWVERMRGIKATSTWMTRLGLFLLLGSTFLQSLPRGAVVYTSFLALESLLAILWGVRNRSRDYVRYGALAFFLNVFVQVGAGFVTWPRWLQIGLTGGTLFGGGLLALAKREELIATRERLSKTWEEWEA